MSLRSPYRLGLVALIGVSALLLAAYLALWRTPSVSVETNGVPHFQDRRSQAGITFRTNFLADEQGEKFKINLYDHGSGVAIGDFDGDGRDDIYFVNQLGPNALYRNVGDGTFADVTEKAGVAVGDRICVTATFADYDNDGHQDLFVTSI